MNVGFIGLGKLGLPVSVAMALHADVDGVYGYDTDSAKVDVYAEGQVDLYEPGIEDQLREARKLYFCGSVDEVMRVQPEIVFVAVPTPSLGRNRRFKLDHVKEAISAIACARRGKTTVALISTVLPGDIRREWGMIMDPGVELVYNPSFIAMGTTIGDFMHPEFILMGTADGKPCKVLTQFYSGVKWEGGVPGLPDVPPVLSMTWEEAEITKMAYNTMIGFKIVYANALMEMAHKVGHANVDVISDALGHATKRITSATYMRGGMGDGGGCHPRDNLALSEVARELQLSADPFGAVMNARSAQAAWVADLLLEQELPVVLMGKRYKPNTNLTDYSAAQLVESLLRLKSPETEVEYLDPLLGLCPAERRRSVYLVSHVFDFVRGYDYPEGSVVVDPWRCFDKGDVLTLSNHGVKYLPLGVS